MAVSKKSKKSNFEERFYPELKPEQPFLVDLNGNDLSVCILTRRKYKTQTGRLVSCRLDRTVIQNCRDTYGDYINGYWVIPKEFLK